MCAATRVSKLEVSEKQKRNYHDRISKMTLMKKKGKNQIAFFLLCLDDEISIFYLRKCFILLVAQKRIRIRISKF